MLIIHFMSGNHVVNFLITYANNYVIGNNKKIINNYYCDTISLSILFSKKLQVVYNKAMNFVVAFV